MKGYYTSVYPISYTMNIKQLKEKVLFIMKDINDNFDTYFKKELELHFPIYTINNKNIIYYLYAGITLYNELFLLVDKPKGIKGITYDMYRNENNRIVYKNIILKLGLLEPY